MRPLIMQIKFWTHQGADTTHLNPALSSQRQPQLLGCGQGIQQLLMTSSQTGKILAIGFDSISV